MSHKFRESTYTYKCPKCKNVIKTVTDSELTSFILVILFPIGIIYLICKFIASLGKKKTITGNEVIRCPNCGKLVGINHNIIGGSSYLIKEKKELIDYLMPTLKEIAKKGIDVQEYHIDEKDYVGLIKFRFLNRKTQDIFNLDVYYNMNGSLWVVGSGITFEYNPKTLKETVYNNLLNNNDNIEYNQNVEDKIKNIYNNQNSVNTSLHTELEKLLDIAQLDKTFDNNQNAVLKFAELYTADKSLYMLGTSVEGLEDVPLFKKIAIHDNGVDIDNLIPVAVTNRSFPDTSVKLFEYKVKEIVKMSLNDPTCEGICIISNNDFNLIIKRIFLEKMIEII